MKKINTLLFFVLSSLLAGAQITLVSTDMPTAGWTNVEQKDTSTRVVNWGNRGANQVYDFSAFVNNEPDSVFYSTPTTAQTSAVPGTNLAGTADHNTYLLAKNSTSLFEYDGLQTPYSGTTFIVPFSTPDSEYLFPAQYGQTFAGNYGFTYVTSGSSVGQSAIYEIELVNTTTYTDTIDGWGIVKTPVGSYNCLRQHRVEHSSTQINYKLLSISPWTSYGNPIVSNTNIYYYLTKEAHGSVITFTYDSLNNPLTASWSTEPPAPVANFGFTNGAAGLVTFSDSSTGPPTSYSWNFGDGSPTSPGISPNHTYAANGTYLVCLTVTNASGSNTKCDSVHITNATGGRVPKAVNDTASLVQPGTITLNVLANDSNFNAPDSVCITAVYGAQAGWATISGCSQVIFHPLDSFYTGTDTFYYISCDTRLTQFCDTGMVTVKVTMPAAIASFTYGSAGLQCAAEARSTSQYADSLNWSVIFLSFNGTYRDVSNVDSITIQATADAPFQALVCLTAVNGSGSSQKCDTINWVCTGISETAAADFKVYPNPASDKLSIDISAGGGTVEIYDIIGEKVKSATVGSGTNMVPVNDLSNGTYFITLTDANQNRRALGKIEILR